MFWYAFDSEEWSKLPEVFSSDYLQPVLVSQIFIGLTFVLIITRHLMLIRNLGTVTSYRGLTDAIVISSSLNIFLPARIGDAFRFTFLKFVCLVPFRISAIAFVFEKIVDLAIVCLMLFLISMEYLDVFFISLFLIFFMVLSLILISIFLVSRRANFFLRSRLVFFGELISQVKQIFMPLRLIKFLSITILFWVASIGASFFFWLAMPGYSLKIDEIIFIHFLSTIALAIPFLPAGIGLFEITTYYTMQNMGYANQDLLLVTFLYHLVFILYAIPGIFLMLLRRDLGVVKAMIKLQTLKDLVIYKKRD